MSQAPLVQGKKKEKEKRLHIPMFFIIYLFIYNLYS